MRPGFRRRPRIPGLSGRRSGSGTARDYDRSAPDLSFVPSTPDVRSNVFANVVDIKSTVSKLELQIEWTAYEPQLGLRISGVSPIVLKPELGMVGRDLTVNVLHADGLRPDIALVGNQVSIEIPGNLRPTTPK